MDEEGLSPRRLRALSVFTTRVQRRLQLYSCLLLVAALLRARPQGDVVAVVGAVRLGRLAGAVEGLAGGAQALAVARARLVELHGWPVLRRDKGSRPQERRATHSVITTQPHRPHTGCYFCSSRDFTETSVKYNSVSSGEEVVQPYQHEYIRFIHFNIYMTLMVIRHPATRYV